MALSVACRSTFSIFSPAIPVASKMDTNWTFNSSSSMMEVDDAALKNACAGSNWTWEEDKAFENALAAYYNDANMWDRIASAVPGKTIEDIKHRYEALCNDVEAIESGNVPVPDYSSNVSVRKGKKKSEQAQRGAPWTEEEHRQFLYGLERFGRGDWKSIARYCVRTKSNSQVASHAQKYFKRLNSAKEGKRLSINNIRSVNPEKLLAFEKATTSCMPGCCNEKSMDSGNQLLPEHTTEASVDGENQLLREYSAEASANAGKQPMRKRPRKASTAKNQLVNQCPIEGSSSIDGKKPWPRRPKKAQSDMGNQLRPGFPEKAPTETGNQLLQHGCPKKARSDVSNQLLPPSPFVGTSDTSPFSGSGSSAPMFQVFDISSPPFAVEPVQEASGPTPPVEMSGHPAPSDEIAGFYSMDAVMHVEPVQEAGGPTPPVEMPGQPTPSAEMAGFYSMDAVMHVESVQEAGGPTPPVEMPGQPTPSAEMAGFYSTDAVMQVEPVQEAGGPAPPVEMPGHPVPSDEMAGWFYSTDAVMQDADVSVDGEYEIGCSTEIMDLDLSLFPHFLD